MSALPATQVTQLAFIGLGGLGKAITKNLVQYGKLEKPLILYNRTIITAQSHSEAIGNSRAVEILAEVVSVSNIIWSCLQNSEAVESVFEQILKNDIQGKLFVESSTLTTEAASRLTDRVLAAGGRFVALPVMGDPSVAEKRGLILIAAGPAESVDCIIPYLVGVTAKSIVDLRGEDPSKASLLKIMGNVIIMTTMETVAEINVFAEKSGLGTHNMNKLMTQLFPNPPHSIYNERMLNGDYYLAQKTIVELSKARELSSHVLELAKASGASIKSYEVAAEHLKVAEKHVGEKGDILGIYGAVRMESGLQYGNRDS